ncbi:unnamed protein product, partial [Protopolystoma xenopodis]
MPVTKTPLPDVSSNSRRTSSATGRRRRIGLKAVVASHSGHKQLDLVDKTSTMPLALVPKMHPLQSPVSLPPTHRDFLLLRSLPEPSGPGIVDGVEEANGRLNSDDIFDIKTSGRHLLFCGTQVIQTRNYADERVLAVVSRTGFQTAKGEMVRAILFPKPMKFKFTQDAFQFVGALAVIAVIGFGISVYIM